MRAGRAAAGRTRSRPGRGSGGRAPPAGRSALGGARGPSPQASDSRRGRLRPDSVHHRAPRERLQRTPSPGGRGAPRGAALTWALRAARPGQQDRLCTGRRRAAAGQALHAAALHGQRDTAAGSVLQAELTSSPSQPARWTAPGLPTSHPCSPDSSHQGADSPDTDTGGRGQRGGGSRLRGGTLSHQRHSLGEGAAIGRGEALLAQVMPSQRQMPTGGAKPSQETPPSCPLTIAVTPAAGTRQRVGTGGLGAGPGLAAGVAFLTPALLAGVSGVGEALAVHKHLILQDTVWAGAGGMGAKTEGAGAGRQLLSPWGSELPCKWHLGAVPIEGEEGAVMQARVSL